MVFSQYSKSSKKRGFGKANIKSNSQKLPKNISDIEVKIHQLSSKGVGVGYISQQDKEKYQKNKVYVPNTIPGEVVRVHPTKKTGKGLEAKIIELVTPSSERQSPKCNAYLNCGGCQLQHMTYDAYLEWKQQTIFKLFQKSNIVEKEFGGFFASKLQQRRRASFKFKRTQEKSFIGFYARKSHQIIELEGCIVLCPELLKTKQIILQGLDKILPIGASLSIQINQYDTGSDILIIAEKKVSKEVQTELAVWASDTDIKRISLSYSGELKAYLIYQKSPPSIIWGGIIISPPPGSFLQPTLFGEKILQQEILSAYKNAKHCLDLFAGCGTLSANLLSQKVKITAIDTQIECLQAYKAGYQNFDQDNLLKVETRDLINAPVMSSFLNHFDGIILDPPRNGANEQIKQISMSHCPSVTYVSCNPISFINDAKILIKAGYQLKKITLIDQFSWTTHSELIGNFEKK